jgi:hypothetical protein
MTLGISPRDEAARLVLSQLLRPREVWIRFKRGPSARGRFGPSAKPSWNDRYLRSLAIASSSPKARESARNPKKLQSPRGAHEGTLKAAHFPAPRPCPRHGPQSLADGFRPLAHPPSGGPKGSSPFDGSLRPEEPPSPVLSLVEGLNSKDRR